MTSLVVTVHHWLSLLGVRVNKTFIKERLISHPDYPSARCVTSLLDELSILNEVAQVDEETLMEMGTPFLAFVAPDGFILVKDITHTVNSIKDFNVRWNGVVVVAEKPAHIAVPDALQEIQAWEKQLRMKGLALISVCMLLTFLVLTSLSYANNVLLILNLSGLLVCSTIVLRELGIPSLISRKLCGEGDKTGCDTVLGTNASVVLPGVRISDVGIAFFSGVVALLWMSSVAAVQFRSAADTLITVCCFLAIPFTVFSVYYQWKVAQAWCSSCLTVVVILWCSAITRFGTGIQLHTLTTASLLSAAGMSILPGAVWLLIRNVLNQHRELSQRNLLLQRFYRSPELLEAHLLRQEKVDSTPWPYDFQLGNAEASCQIIVVSSFFCGPCSDVFLLLQGLLAKHKNDVGITVRFLNGHAGSAHDRKANVQRHMLRYALSTEGFLTNPGKVKEMLAAWYAVMDIDKFKALYPVDSLADVEFILETQQTWCRASAITYTPTVIINGHKLESPYAADDLLALSTAVVEMFPVSEVHSEVSLIANEK